MIFVSASKVSFSDVRVSKMDAVAANYIDLEYKHIEFSNSKFISNFKVYNDYARFPKIL